MKMTKTLLIIPLIAVIHRGVMAVLFYRKEQNKPPATTAKDSTITTISHS
jgi:hypothetical protein